MSQYVFTMNRVGKIVPPKRHILKDISLSFFPGAKIGVLGTNGSGKSTMLRVLAGQRHSRVERGVYRLVGVDPATEQTWGVYARAVLAFSAVSVLFLYGFQRLQNHLWLSKQPRLAQGRRPHRRLRAGRLLQQPLHQRAAMLQLALGAALQEAGHSIHQRHLQQRRCRSVRLQRLQQAALRMRQLRWSLRQRLSAPPSRCRPPSRRCQPIGAGRCR